MIHRSAVLWGYYDFWTRICIINWALIDGIVIGRMGKGRNGFELLLWHRTKHLAEIGIRFVVLVVNRMILAIITNRSCVIVR